MLLASALPMEVGEGVRELAVRRVLKEKLSARHMEVAAGASILDALRVQKGVLITVRVSGSNCKKSTSDFPVKSS